MEVDWYTVGNWYTFSPNSALVHNSPLGRDTFTQKSEFHLGQYELVLQMYQVDQRKKNYVSILALDPPWSLSIFSKEFVLKYKGKI